jgi:hypothetical protein
MNLIYNTRRNIRDETFIKDEQGRWFDSSHSDHKNEVSVRMPLFYILNS